MTDCLMLMQIHNNTISSDMDVRFPNTCIFIVFSNHDNFLYKNSNYKL